MTIDAEAELLLEYRRNRSDLEAQEDTVKHYMSKGEAYTQEILGRVHQLIGKRTTSMEPWFITKQNLQRNEVEYFAELAKERRAIIQQQEEVEQKYRKKRQELES